MGEPDLFPAVEPDPFPDDPSLSQLVDRLGGLSLLLFLLSFFLPAFSTGYGFMVFFIALAYPPVWPLWAANPLFVYGVIHFLNGHWAKARRAGALAIVLVCSEAWMFAGVLNVGFFLWASSMVCLTISGVYAEHRERRRELADTAIRVLR